MGKIRSKAPWALDVPGHGTVEPDAVIEVADADVYGYTACANWDAVDKAATTAHNAGEKAEAKAVKAERDARAPHGAEESAEPAEEAPPADV